MLKCVMATLLLSVVGSSSACGSLNPGGTRPEKPRADADSVEFTGRVLYGLVQSLDAWGRRAGHLPADLAAVDAQTRDAWGREIGYRSSGLRFELRSAGADNLPETSDDVVATGQLGRNRPCELRSERRVDRWEEFAPPCTPDTPVVVLPLCPSLLRAELTAPEPGSPTDSIAAVGVQLVGIARRIDGASREVGGLIPTMRIPGSEPLGRYWGFWDVWRNAIQYTFDDQVFELRSAGSDRLKGTADDLVLVARLGQPVRCEYRVGGVRRTCQLPPPPC